jgi:exonuclease SbcD
MKFVHMADCHVGSWRDPKMGFISTEAFCRAVDISVERKVDFILICGDLFNTSIPGIDKLKTVAKKLRELRDIGIPVYLIAGSHDYSPSGKTMLDVLESADLLVNATKGEVRDGRLFLKFTTDAKTGAKITGVLGRRNMLDRYYYESLDRESLEKESGFRIFMFHTGLDEFKAKGMEHVDTAPLSVFPKGFDYYAGGHVHMVMDRQADGYGRIVYPGPLFPNSFSELEELHHGGFFIYDNGSMEFVPIMMYDTEHISLDCSQKSPEAIKQELAKEIGSREVQHKIVTIRLFGRISNGKLSDVDLRDIFAMLYERKAYFVMKNTNKLEAEGFEEIRVEHASVEEIENALIREHLGQVRVSGIDLAKEKELIVGLMKVLSAEKNEGERVIDFEKRIREEAGRIINI